MHEQHLSHLHLICEWHISVWPAAAPEEVSMSRERPRTLHNTQYYYHCYHCGRQSDYSLFTKVWISVDYMTCKMLQCRISMAGTVTDSHSPAVTWLPFQNSASVLIHTTYYRDKIHRVSLTWLPFQNSASVIIHTKYYSDKIYWISLIRLLLQNSATVMTQWWNPLGQFHVIISK